MSAAAILRKIFGWSPFFQSLSLFSKFSFNYSLDRKKNCYVLTLFQVLIYTLFTRPNFSLPESFFTFEPEFIKDLLNKGP